MIHIVIEFLISELNTYIVQRAGTAEIPTLVVADNLVKRDGTPNNSIVDKVVLVVVNIAEDHVYHSVQRLSKDRDRPAEISRPSTQVNLCLMFVGNHEKYSESLKHISYVITFFQQHPAFDYVSIMDMAVRKGYLSPEQAAEGRGGRIVFKLFSPTFEQQNHIWGMLGAKFMPSVMYQVGILNITEGLVEGEIPVVTDISANENTP